LQCFGRKARIPGPQLAFEEREVDPRGESVPHRPNPGSCLLGRLEPPLTSDSISRCWKRHS
jgi:hypothetical protein